MSSGGRPGLDGQGRVIALVDAEGHRLTRTFDRDGRCLGVTGFDGASIAYTYDHESGLLTSRRDDRGVERFQHDSAGRVVRHERPGGGWTGYAPANVIASTVSAIPYTVAGGFVAPVRPAIPVPVTPGG